MILLLKISWKGGQMTRKDFIKLADSLGIFQHYLLNDEQESSEDLVFEYRNLVDNIKTICKQSNSNFQSHLFEEQVQKTYLEHKKN